MGLFFRSLQKILGDRVNVITSGAAPISSSVKQFFKCAFGCKVISNRFCNILSLVISH